MHWVVEVIYFVIHAIAFSDKSELTGRFLNTSRANFKNSMDISAYSFIEVARRAHPLMKDNGGTLITLTYQGSNRVVPNYNVMGVAKAALESSVRYLAADLGSWDIRVNAISPGPIRTRAASGIGDFETLTRFAESNAPMHRGVTQEEVGRAALFLLSSLSSGITGEVLFCDAGYNIIGAAFNPAD